MRMGIRSAMVWERDGNENEVHKNGNYDVGVGETLHSVTSKHLQLCLC